MQSKKLIIPGIFAILLLILFLTFPTIEKSDAARAFYTTSGVVEDVVAVAETGVSLKLQNQEGLYFLAHARDSDVNTFAVREKFTGKVVEIHYQHNMLTLPTSRQIIKVSKVTANTTTLYID